MSAYVSGIIRANILQIVFLIIDFILVMSSESQRHNIFYAIALFFMQFLIMAANVGIIFARLANIYPFKVGLVGTAIKEFSYLFYVSGIYFISFLVLRVYQVTLIPSCDKNCDLWTEIHVAMNCIFRLAGVTWYFSHLRSMVSLCNPRYHLDTYWMPSLQVQNDFQ